MSADDASPSFDEVVQGFLDSEEWWALPEGVRWPEDVKRIHALAVERIRRELSQRAANVLDYMAVERMAYLYALARKRDTPPATGEGDAPVRDHGWDNDRVLREATNDFTRMLDRTQARWDKADAADAGAAVKRQLVHVLDQVLADLDPRVGDPLRERLFTGLEQAGL